MRSAIRHCGIWITVPILLFTAGPWGCAEENNGDPVFSVPLEDVSFRANVASKIDIFANDGDGDVLSYDFVIDPEPPTQTMGLGGKPDLAELDNNHALFTWTPGAADAGTTASPLP